MKKTGKGIGKAFKKLAKVAFRAAVFVFLLAAFLIAAATLAVQMMVSPEALKVIITARLQEAFRRPVFIRDVKFNVYQGIRVQGLQVRESPEFSGGDLLTSDYLVAKYRWRALLRKQLEFEQITMVAPRIQLVRRQDGRWNLEGILSSSSTRRSALDLPQLSLLVDLFARVISIEHGVVTVKDLRRDRQVAFQGLSLTVRDFDVEKPFALAASFDDTQGFWERPVHTRGALRGSVSLAGLQLDQAVFRAEDIEVQSGGRAARASLSLKDFLHPRIEAALRLPAFDSGFLGRYHAVPEGLSIPASRWRARFSFPEENQFRADSVTGTAGALKIQANGSLGLSKGAKPFRVAWAFPSVPLQEAAAVWEGFGKYKLSGRASGSGGLVGDLADLDHTLAVERIELSLEDFAGVFFKNQRLVHVDARLSGARNFESLSVAMDRGSLTSFGSVFSNLDFAANIRKGDLEFDRLNGSWDISHFKLRGRVRKLSAPTEVRVEGSVDKLRLDAAITAFLKLLGQLKARRPETRTTRARRLWSQVFKYSIPKAFPATSGRVRVGEVVYPDFQTFSLDTRWALRGISTGLDSANGDVRIGFGPGRVADIPALEAQDPHNILRVIFLPFVFMHRLNNLSVISAATAYPKSIDFTRIYGDYGLRRGVVNVRLFHVDSSELLAYADGLVDFPREKVGLHILTRLNRSRGPLPEYLTDEKGRPSIGFFVEDNLNKPSLRLEYRKMGSDAIEKALQAGLERGRKIFSKEAL